jgi:hypothetical protein
MHDDRDELDRLLDSALATYADPGPGADLERRILGRIAAEAVPVPRRSWLPWAMALTVAAGLLLVAVLMGTRQVHELGSVPPQARTSEQQSGPGSGEVGGKHIIRSESSGKQTPGPKGRDDFGRLTAVRAKALTYYQPCPDTKPRTCRAFPEASAAPLPKLDVFPTPQAPSSQERALARYVAQTPESMQEALAKSLEQDVPLTVASIRTLPTLHTLTPQSPDAIQLGPPSESQN